MLREFSGPRGSPTTGRRLSLTGERVTISGRRRPGVRGAVVLALARRDICSNGVADIETRLRRVFLTEPSRGFDLVFEFAHIARPLILSHHLKRRIIEPLGIAPFAHRDTCEEMI